MEHDFLESAWLCARVVSVDSLELMLAQRLLEATRDAPIARLIESLATISPQRLWLVLT